MDKWLPCPDFPSYELSDDGLVRRAFDGHRIAQRIGNSGYWQAQIGPKRGRKMILVHRYLARAFLGEPADRTLTVAHCDGDKLNNKVSNLRWATQAENLSDMRKHGTAFQGYQQRNYRGSIAPLARGPDGRFLHR